MVIGLQGVRDVVDAAGGVEIDVPQPIHDEAYPTDDYGIMVLDIPAVASGWTARRRYGTLARATRTAISGGWRASSR